MFLAQHMLLPWDIQIRDKEESIITKPTCIISYNHNMGGVDMMDQQLDAIDVLRKSYKWYKTLFLWLVRSAVYQHTNNTSYKVVKMTFCTFLLVACTHLLIIAPKFKRQMKRTAVEGETTGHPQRNSC